MSKHAVHRLFEKRMATVTRPFNARGAAVKRCSACRIDVLHCICANRPPLLTTAAGFLLLYYDDEVLKPSNTGKLIADLCADTFAFLWRRTEVDADVLALLQDPVWYPILVFPEQYAPTPRRQVQSATAIPASRRPLFVMLDGSWREAKKMFRKSPYLDNLPLFSLQPETISAYQVRKAARAHQLATAEVASAALAMLGELRNAQIMNSWFEVFSYQYQKGVMRKNLGNADALARLRTLTGPNF